MSLSLSIKCMHTYICSLLSRCTLQYYNAKQFKEDSPGEALEWFEKVVAAETPPAECSFKATKQMVKLHLRQGDHGKMMEKYQVVLERIKARALVP